MADQDHSRRAFGASLTAHSSRVKGTEEVRRYHLLERPFCDARRREKESPNSAWNCEWYEAEQQPSETEHQLTRSTGFAAGRLASWAGRRNVTLSSIPGSVITSTSPNRRRFAMTSSTSISSAEAPAVRPTVLAPRTHSSSSAIPAAMR